MTLELQQRSPRGKVFRSSTNVAFLWIFFTVDHLTTPTCFPYLLYACGLFFVSPSFFLCASSTNCGLYETKNSLTRLLPTTPIQNHSPGGKTLQLSARTVAAVTQSSPPPPRTKSNRTEELAALTRCPRTTGSQPTEAPKIIKTDPLPRIKMSTKVWWPSGASQVSETAER